METIRVMGVNGKTVMFNSDEQTIMNLLLNNKPSMLGYKNAVTVEFLIGQLARKTDVEITRGSVTRVIKKMLELGRSFIFCYNEFGYFHPTNNMEIHMHLSHLEKCKVAYRDRMKWIGKSMKKRG